MKVVLVVHGDYEGFMPHVPFEAGSVKVDRLPMKAPISIADYDLIVFAPMAFYESQAFFNRRQREVELALRQDKSVVFLTAPMFAQQGQTASALFQHILQGKGIVPQPVQPVRTQPVRNEFVHFSDLFGHATVAFIVGPYDTLLRSGSMATGIVFEVAQGLVYCLPFDLTPLDAPHWGLFLGTLLTAISDYAAARRFTVPDWLKSVTLPGEVPLVARIETLRAELTTTEKERTTFDKFKSILVTKGDALVDCVIGSLTYLLQDAGYACIRNEKYVEDLWLDRSGVGHVAIAEVKGTDDNARRAHINQLDNHRETHVTDGLPGLHHEFPALLIVNTFAKSSSLQEKDQEIDPGVRKHAVANRVLLTRTLDIFRLVSLKQESRLDCKHLGELLTNSVGWLRVEEEPVLVN